jgi:transcriptional regulator with XRE-family HTH domain
MDIDALARDFVVALRGRRSQTALSRRLGYRSNVVYSWEAGRRHPTAAEIFRACARTGRDPRAAFISFFGQEPPWLSAFHGDFSEEVPPELPAALLDDLRGQVSVSDLARRAEVGRSSLSRWLSGQAEPRLPEFFRVAEAASGRLLDLIATFVAPTSLPSAAGVWAEMEARRRGAGEFPWTQAILRAIELDAYRALVCHEPGWIANRLGLEIEEEERCLRFLLDHGLVRSEDGVLRVVPTTVDTRALPEVGRRIKAHWSTVAAAAAGEGLPGQFSYNVFTVSEADFERIREAHLAYFRQLRSIVANSTPENGQPAEVVAVANVQLFPLLPRRA